MSLIQRHGEMRIGGRLSDIVREEQGDTLDLLEEDLLQLSVLVTYTHDEDILFHMHRHTEGVGGRLTWLLRKVARIVLYYNEHHHDD